MRVREVHFNHNRASVKADAINLRLDAETAIVAPEWVDGEPSKPVAYVTSAITEPITVKVRFGDGPPESTVPVCAVGRNLDTRSALDDLLRERRSGFPGGLKPASVRFDAAGNSALVAFEMTGDLSNAPVSINDLNLTWFRKHADEWIEFANTRHRIYLIPERPTHPWTTAADETLAVWPWVKALHKACEWASGAVTPDDATEKIAIELNSQLKQTYDESGTQFVQKNLLTNRYEFLLSDYLSELDNAPSFVIDCRGIATALTTFANLMGAELLPLVIENKPPIGSSSTGTMHTKPVKPLRGVFSPRDWGWHEVVLHTPVRAVDSSGGILPGVPPVPIVTNTPFIGPEPLHIYDALLQVNSLKPTLPIQMSLGIAHVPDSGYLFQLIQIGNAEQITPKPTRAVI